jgi:hypothetical protein
LPYCADENLYVANADLRGKTAIAAMLVSAACSEISGYSPLRCIRSCLLSQRKKTQIAYRDGDNPTDSRLEQMARIDLPNLI